MASRSPIPAAFFGMVLGLVGLGGSWRAAASLWGMPRVIGEAIMAIAAAVWITLLFAYAMKWLGNRREALAEVDHPIHCCFVGLVPASTSLMGVALAPHSHMLAVIAWVMGAGGQLMFGVFRSGGMWRGARDIGAITPVLLLPTVAGNLISSVTAGILGFSSWGILFLGIGVFNWLAMESVILFRLWTATPIPAALRPTLGIQLAPPVVATLAYLANVPSGNDLIAQAMWGYGVFQLLMLARLIPWISENPFAPSYWAFSFGITALSTGGLLMMTRGAQGAIPTLAPAAFVLANMVMLVLVAGTVVRIFQGRMLPPPLAPPVTAA